MYKTQASQSHFLKKTNTEEFVLPNFKTTVTTKLQKPRDGEENTEVCK